MNLTEIAKLILERSMSIGAFIALLLATSAFLDWKLKDALKSKFLTSVYGKQSKAKSWTGELPTYYSAIHSLFGLSNFSRFLTRSLLATILMLTALSILQAIVNEAGFERATAPFIERITTLDIGAIIILLGIIVIDLVSIYQTATFLRISRGCQNIWEVMFVGIADVTISVLLFIVLFPIFVTASFFVNAPKTKTFPILMSSSLTKQDTSLSSLRSLLVFDAPPSHDPIDEKPEDLLARGWHFRTYTIAAVEAKAGANLSEAIKSANAVGSIVVQTKGIVTDEKVLNAFTHMLRERPYIKSVQTLDSVQNFYNAYAYLQLTVDSSLTPGFFWQTYGGLIRKINFLDADLLRVLTLRSPALSGNDAAFQYNLRSITSRTFKQEREQYIYCDGKYAASVAPNAYEPAASWDKCTEAIAVSPIAFANMRSLSLYDDNPNTIPISPLALSSLTATIMIYYLLISKVIFSLVRPIFVATMKDGDKFLRRHIFTVSLFFIFILSAPPFALLSFFMQRQ